MIPTVTYKHPVEDMRKDVLIEARSISIRFPQMLLNQDTGASKLTSGKSLWSPIETTDDEFTDLPEFTETSHPELFALFTQALKRDELGELELLP